MLIYYFLALSIFLTKLLLTKGKIYSKRHEQMIYIIWFALLTFVSGMRGSSVGTDTLGYLRRYLIAANQMSGELYQERAYTFITVILGKISNNPQTILIVCAAITSFGFLYFVKHNSERPALSVFLFLGLYYYFMSMNCMRQFVAIALLLVAFEHAKNRKIIMFILFVLLATAFHSTGLVGLVFWWLCKPNITRKRLIIIAVICLVLLALSPYVLRLIIQFNPTYSVYVNQARTEGNFVGIMLPIVYISIFLVGLVATIDTEWRNDRNMQLFCMIEISAIWSITAGGLGFFDGNIIQRISWPFQVFSICLIPNVLNSSLFKKNKTFFYCVFLIAGLSYMTYYLNLHWHRVVPYVFFWDTY